MLKKLIMLAFCSIILISCNENHDLYSQNIDNLIKTIKKYDVEQIQNNTVILISKDLQEIKKIKKNNFKNINEGDEIIYKGDEPFIENNNKLKHKIKTLIEQLNKQNKNLEIKL